MKPSRRYTLSLVLNGILVLAFLGTVFAAFGPVLPDQHIRDQLLSLEYPTEDYQAYLASTDAGLCMSYTEYLHRKYPVNFLNWTEQGPKTYFLCIREVSEDEVRNFGEANYFRELTDQDLSLYPLLADIFVADVPFSFIRAYRYELNALVPFTRENTVVVWHNTTYRLWELEL